MAWTSTINWNSKLSCVYCNCHLILYADRYSAHFWRGRNIYGSIYFFTSLYRIFLMSFWYSTALLTWQLHFHLNTKKWSWTRSLQVLRKQACPVWPWRTTSSTTEVSFACANVKSCTYCYQRTDVAFTLGGRSCLQGRLGTSLQNFMGLGSKLLQLHKLSVIPSDRLMHETFALDK